MQQVGTDWIFGAPPRERAARWLALEAERLAYVENRPPGPVVDGDRVFDLAVRICALGPVERVELERRMLVDRIPTLYDWRFNRDDFDAILCLLEHPRPLVIALD